MVNQKDPKKKQKEQLYLVNSKYQYKVLDILIGEILRIIVKKV